MNKTNRGFVYQKFVDTYGEVCSIQKSSSTNKQCIWLGIENATPKIMANDALKLGMYDLLNDKDEISGWVDYPFPKEVFISTRMHIDRKMAKEIGETLLKFADTGELE
jgi:Leu/Phe-tRNA-protein transferase